MFKSKENKEIIQAITLVIERFPEMRFNQILHSLNIISTEGDSLHDEPSVVLNKIKEADLYKVSSKRDSYKGVF